MLDRATSEMLAVIGADVFSTDGRSLEHVVGDLLRARFWRIATAESCTGGLVASRLTDVPGSSDYVERGVVCYSNRAKTAAARRARGDHSRARRGQRAGRSGDGGRACARGRRGGGRRHHRHRRSRRRHRREAGRHRGRGGGLPGRHARRAGSCSWRARPGEVPGLAGRARTWSGGRSRSSCPRRAPDCRSGGTEESSCACSSPSNSTRPCGARRRARPGRWRQRSSGRESVAVSPGCAEPNLHLTLQFLGEVDRADRSRRRRPGERAARRACVRRGPRRPRHVPASRRSAGHLGWGHRGSRSGWRCVSRK